MITTVAGFTAALRDFVAQQAAKDRGVVLRNINRRGRWVVEIRGSCGENSHGSIYQLAKSDEHENLLTAVGEAIERADAREARFPA